MVKFRTPPGTFGDLRLNQHVCLKTKIMAIEHGNVEMLVRPIERISGNGRVDLIVFYPMDSTLTQKENEDACFAIMCRLEGMDPKSVRDFIAVTLEEITLAEPAAPATVVAP